MIIPKGKIEKHWYDDTITVHFDVDDLMKGNTPHTNFWTFCLLNDLVEPDPEDNTRFRSKITNVELWWSDNEDFNDKVEAMFKKLKIEINF